MRLAPIARRAQPLHKCADQELSPRIPVSRARTARPADSSQAPLRWRAQLVWPANIRRHEVPRAAKTARRARRGSNRLMVTSLLFPVHKREPSPTCRAHNAKLANTNPTAAQRSAHNATLATIALRDRQSSRSAGPHTSARILRHSCRARRGRTARPNVQPPRLWWRVAARPELGA